MREWIRFSLFLLLATCIFCEETELTDGNYKEYIESHPYTFVKLYTPQCGWCQALKPVWTETSRQLEGIIPLVSLNVNEYTKARDYFKIRGVPTILFFSGKVDKYEPYTGTRTEKALISYVFSKIPLLELDYEHGISYLNCSNSFPPRIALISTEKDETYANELFKKYHELASVASVVVSDNQESDIISQFSEIKNLPAAIALVGGKTIVLGNRDFGITSKENSLLLELNNHWSNKKEELTPASFAVYFFVTIGVVALLLCFLFIKSSNNIKKVV